MVFSSKNQDFQNGTNPYIIASVGYKADKIGIVSFYRFLRGWILEGSCSIQLSYAGKMLFLPFSCNIVNKKMGIIYNLSQEKKVNSELTINPQ